MEDVGCQTTHQPRQTKTASQSVPKKKVWITIPNLVPFSNYLQVLFPSNFCQLLTSHLLVRLWLCLWVTSLQGLVGGGRGCLRSIRYFLETWHKAFMSWLFLSSNNILLMCKSPKKFFWVMSFLYCLRKDPTIPCAGLTKVAGCRWKSLSTWLVSASYSAWRFFTDGVF